MIFFAKVYLSIPLKRCSCLSKQGNDEKELAERIESSESRTKKRKEILSYRRET